MTAPPALDPAISEAEYRAIPALSASSAKWLLRSPAHYKHNMENRTDKATFDVGHAAHSKILGHGSGVIAYPDEHLTPSGAISSKQATAAWASEQRSAGLIPVAPQQIAAVDAMSEAVLAHPEARRVLELPGETELPLIADDPATGVRIKGRIDRLANDDGRLVPVDLKTTADASPVAFANAIAKFGYDIQGEMYRRLVQIVRGVEPEPFLIIAVESARPHGVLVLDVIGWYAEIGLRRLERALTLYAESTRTGYWPAYPPVIHHPDPPAWLSFAEDDDQEMVI